MAVTAQAAARPGYRPVRVTVRSKEAGPAVDDAEVIRRVRSGETDAFGVLVDRYGARIARLVRGFVRNEEDARDVVQDAFVKAFARLDRFDGRAAFYTWLYRIAANTAMDHNKKVRRRPPALPLEESPDEDAKNAVSPPAPGPSPARGAMTAELRRSIDDALDGLPDVYREVIVLREMEGLSYEDISRVLRVSRGTVESRLFRARERLRERLRREFKEWE
jgi:RNA polymerase sigma-70 factor (ECF subfamily)